LQGPDHDVKGKEAPATFTLHHYILPVEPRSITDIDGLLQLRRPVCRLCRVSAEQIELAVMLQQEHLDPVTLQAHIVPSWSCQPVQIALVDNAARRYRMPPLQHQESVRQDLV
jgi:hypothetical protein